MKHPKSFRFFPAVLLALALAVSPLTVHAAPASAGPAGAWGWVLDLPSLLMQGVTSIWERVGASTNPDGQPVPGEVAIQTEGASVDPDGQPVPLGTAVQGVGASVDPDGQPQAGTAGGEGDEGHLIDPMG